jgi:hypothetical protein
MISSNINIHISKLLISQVHSDLKGTVRGRDALTDGESRGGFTPAGGSHREGEGPGGLESEEFRFSSLNSLPEGWEAADSHALKFCKESLE